MRNRNMLRLTGLPGWMRFGYSPGWVGRSATGLGPCAEYLLTGQWPTPQMAAAMQGGFAAPMMGAMQGGFAGPMAGGMPGANLATQVEQMRMAVNALQQQLAALEQRLAQASQSE